MKPKKSAKKSQYRELIKRIREERKKMNLEQLEVERKTIQLRKKVLGKRSSIQEKLQKDIAKKFGIDLAYYNREHKKVKELKKRELKKQETSLLDAAIRGASYHVQTLKAIRSLVAKYETEKSNPTRYVSLWFAEEEPNSEEIPYADPADYEHDNEVIVSGGAGEQFIRKKLHIANAGDIGGSVTTRDEFDFVYEPPDSGVGEVLSWIDPIGIASFDSEDVCWPSHSESGGYMKAYISAAQEQFGVPNLWPEKEFEILPNTSVEDGKSFSKSFYREYELSYTNALPILEGTPLVITVGTELKVWSGGFGNEAKFDFNSRSRLRITIPSVWIIFRT